MANNRKSGKGKIVAVIAVMIILIVALPFATEFFDNTSNDGETVTIIVPKGASSDEIAQILKENDLVRSSLVFRLKAKLSDNGSKMNYGTFSLHRGMCIDDIIDTLAGTYASEETLRLTIPEGYSIEQIGILCEEAGLFSREDFYSAAQKSDYGIKLTDNKNVKFALQGYLYPETYEFYKTATAEDVIKKLVGQFNYEIEKAQLKTDKSLEEIIIIASLIEREALLEKEMKTISGVIYNRLEKGMRLQVDAAVQYAVSDGLYNVERIKYSDLEIDSPYNTYKIDALPAGAICNPGIKAIVAACEPEKHSYLYYHTDMDKDDGSHIFTRTYEEHLSTQ